MKLKQTSKPATVVQWHRKKLACETVKTPMLCCAVFCNFDALAAVLCFWEFVF
jgi:hypothetical protein